jgi:hypothetical protein
VQDDVRGRGGGDAVRSFRLRGGVKVTQSVYYEMHIV